MTNTCGGASTADLGIGSIHIINYSLDRGPSHVVFPFADAIYLYALDAVSI